MNDWGDFVLSGIAVDRFYVEHRACGWVWAAPDWNDVPLTDVIVLINEHRCGEESG